MVNFVPSGMVLIWTETDDGAERIVAKADFDAIEEIAQEVADGIDAAVIVEAAGARDVALEYQILHPKLVKLTFDAFVPAQGYDVADVIDEINEGLAKTREILG